jgi:phage virion morphogenesis protein
MVAVTVTVEGLGDIEARLSGMLAKMDDLTPLMDRIGQAMETTTGERFERGVAPSGVAWKKSNKPSGKTLIDTSRLKNSVTHRASRDSVEIGTNVIYGAIHQFGGTIRARSGKYLKFKLPGKLGFRSVESVIIPARPFIGIDAEDRQEIPALVEDYLLEGDGE